jgi:hypothetical protein
MLNSTGPRIDPCGTQMKANPDKFQAIAIGKKSMDKNIVLDLAGNKIKCEKEVKVPTLTYCFLLVR